MTREEIDALVAALRLESGALPGGTLFRGAIADVLEAQARTLSDLQTTIDRMVSGKDAQLKLATDIVLDASKEHEAKVSDLQIEVERLRKALQELVAVRDLKERCEGYDARNGLTEEKWEEHDHLMDDYDRRKPLAWEAARKALASPTGS